jgi:D-amino-acid dehydrogenase
MSNIAVIGAGIAGVTAAYYLAKEGHNVTVYEQESYPAMRTSYANGGQISVSNSEVWTTWSNVKKGVKWMFQKDAPFLVRPSLSWDKVKWLSQFLYHTLKNDYEKNTKETIKLGLESRELYRDIIQQEQLRFDFSTCGILHIYKDQKYFDAAISAQKIYEDNGCEWRILNSDQTKYTEPYLEHVQGIIGGAWTADDSVGDIHQFCVELAQVLREKYNVPFVFNKKIDKCQFEELEKYYDKIVVANGIGAIKLSKYVGDNLPIYPVKGYSITINNVSPNLLPKVSLLDDQAKIVTSTLGNRLRVAGTAEFDDENYDIRRDRIEPLLQWVKTNLPSVSTKDYSSWACLRPMTPNMLPIVRQSKKNEKVFYHVGHGHLGWTLSPATAKQLCNLI